VQRKGNFGGWATLIGAVVVGAVVALIIGILIGNATEQTKTVTLGQADVLTPQSNPDRSTSPRAPVFTKETLAALPQDNWITNGGSLSNDRYSPLQQINTNNVEQLKGVWRTHLGSPTTAKYSQEGQTLVYNGVIYATDGASDVFAVDVASGRIKWRYKADIDDQLSTACCGWNNRGVAIGDGRVYVAQLDGDMVALDMATGRELWRNHVADWQDGYTMTAAPLYYDGKVIEGVAGGEFGIRGRLAAYDAKTGHEVWRFYTTPDPNSNDPGANTWPKDNDSWKTGGAPIWQTPSVDPELNMLYFSTGNASPDLNGELREGDNLFTSSIVALNPDTGKYQWHFQEVHHDIWDYDAPSPTVLYDAVVNGKVVHGIAEPGKTGWLYMLDRKTGKPIFPIPEKPVPQDPNQATAATQPYPSNPPFATQKVDDEDFARIREAADSQVGEGKRKVDIEQGQIFAPFSKTMVAVMPGPAGGNNWPPSSYNQQLQMFYVCSQNSGAGLQKVVKESNFKQGQTFIGSVLVSTGFNDPGTVTAIDAQTGQIVWQNEFDDGSCYSGTATTAGNLVFVGHNNGELEALDARNGASLWRFQTGAGANTTITSFQDGDNQRIAFLSGGNSLAGSARGDSLWVFGLDGSLGPAKAAASNEGAVTHAGEQTNEEQSEQTEKNTVKQTTGDNAQIKGDPDAGQQVFADNCTTCHGAKGTGGNGGPDLSDKTNLPAIVHQVSDGGGGMPAFSGQLDKQQIADVSEYVRQKIAGGG
jgi:alcohol dehydrogenase (cytochrome c)